MKKAYADLTTALSDTEGVAVLGFFYEVPFLNFSPQMQKLFQT